MKVNLKTVIMSDDGKPFYAQSVESAIQQVSKKYGPNARISVNQLVSEINEFKGNEMTIGTTFRRALLSNPSDNPQQQAKPVDPEESQRRFNVANEMIDSEFFDLSEKDRDIIKANIIKLFSISVVGQIMNIINPPAKDKKEK